MSPADFQRFAAEAEAQRRAADPQFFLRDLHAKAQAQRFEPAIPVGEVEDSDWGSLLEEPIREMVEGGQ